jgi:hypothetical protein
MSIREVDSVTWTGTMVVDKFDGTTVLLTGTCIDPDMLLVALPFARDTMVLTMVTSTPGGIVTVVV